ncbi:hypothetical protein [Glutamicibacter sp. 2E12]|uniref:hypothetical protein n=1 Tax=Glutamicibacter sp. 2E12 TaxID=3416181 RepID=UPI003CF3CF61
MSDLLLGTIIGGLIALVGVIYGHWVKRKGDKGQHKVQLVTEQNDSEIEKKKLDFEVLKTTVETLRTDLASLRTRVSDLEARLEVITRKYWRLVHVVRAWVSRYHIDPKEIPDDIREDL